MGEKKARLRKPISAAYIECQLWLVSEAVYQRFRTVEWGRRSSSVANRDWISAVWEYVDDPTGGVEAVFRFTHTCRNDGAALGDSQKFFGAVCRAAGISSGDARLLDAYATHRIKCVEPVPERAQQARTSSAPVPIVWGMALRIDHW